MKVPPWKRENWEPWYGPSWLTGFPRSRALCYCYSYIAIFIAMVLEEMWLKCDHVRKDLSVFKYTFTKLLPIPTCDNHSIFRDVAKLVEHWTGMSLTQVWFPAAARDLSPGVSFQCTLSYGVCTPPCAVACINICVRVKDPVVHVRIRWITETLKHIGWVGRLCLGEIPLGQYTCKK